MTAPITPEARKAVVGAAEKATPGDHVALSCPDTPTDCCDYGVVAVALGRETCRVWLEADARFYALANPSTILAYEAALQALEAEKAALETRVASLIGEPENDVWWKTVVGDQHVPSGEKISVRHLHPMAVKPHYEAARGTAVGDVIAGLIFEAAITRNREKFLVDDLQARATAAEAEVERLKVRIAGLLGGLSRIAMATPGNTNTGTAKDALEWVRVVAECALSEGK